MDEGSDGSTEADILAFFLGGWLIDFLAREELAPGVVGGLLVSYRLRGGLGGVPLLKVGQQVAVKAQSWSLAQVRLLVLCGNLREMGSYLLGFWSWLTQRSLREGDRRCAWGLGSNGGPLEMVL